MLTRKKFLGLTAVALAAPAVITRSANAAEKVITWKSSGHGPASDPSQIYHDKCCNAITKATGGRLTVKPFVGGSIVPAYKEVDAIHDNVLQMAYTCPMYNLDKWKAAGLISSRPGALPGEVAAQLVQLRRRRRPHEQDDGRLQRHDLPRRPVTLAGRGLLPFEGQA